MASDRKIIDLTPVQITAANAAISTLLGIFIPILVGLSKADRKRLRKMAAKRTGYVDSIFAALSANLGIIPASFEIARFTIDKSSRSSLILLYNTLTNIVELLSDSIMILGHQNMDDADAGLKILKEEAAHNDVIKTVLDAILDANKTPRIDHPIVGVAASGTVTVVVKAGMRFSNVGSTSFTLFKGTLITGGVLVAPGDSFVIPVGWTSMRIVNMSATTEGNYKLV